jgi:hypothetical protein
LATHAAIIIDADDYFNAAHEVILDARKRIMLVRWDFDARIKLGDASDDGDPETAGEFIYCLVERTPTSTDSAIQLIQILRGRTAQLRPYTLPEVNNVAAWLAENEILDPEGPEEVFETLSKPACFAADGLGDREALKTTAHEVLLPLRQRRPLQQLQLPRPGLSRFRLRYAMRRREHQAFFR